MLQRQPRGRWRAACRCGSLCFESMVVLLEGG